MIIEMPLINCKIESKFKCTKYCVLNAAGGDNTDANSENIIFIITLFLRHVPFVLLSAKDNQKTIKISRQRIWKIILLEWM